MNQINSPNVTGERSPIVRRPPKTSVMVAHALAERVSRLEPGAVLPPERDLIAELQVGRGTLREALRLLELQGVVVIKTGPRGGPVVVRPDHRPLVDTLSLFLQSSEVPFIDVVEARRVLEADLAGLAADRATREDVARLHSSVAAMEEWIENEDFHRQENLRFHALVAEAARNEVLRVFHSSLKEISDGHAVGVSYGLPHRKAVLKWHSRIANAIAAHDAEASYRAMNDHMSEYQRHIKRNYQTLLTKRIRWLLPTG